MATSQNGFPVLFTNRTTGPLPRLRKFVIPGTDRHFYLRDGSAGFLLAHAILFWHERVEPINGGVWDEWGWAVRPVRGQQSGYSNHASGTAADVNATKHGLGVAAAKSFTLKQIALLHARLIAYRGTLRWGGDYDSRPDAMHIEINADLTTCEKRARALLNTKRGQRILAANPGLKAVILS
jgi:hypothetical protein